MRATPGHQPIGLAGASMHATTAGLPIAAGVGLKPQHFQTITATWPDIGFFEVHAENYLVAGGPFHHYLTRIREHYPLSIHGVGLSIGGAEALDRHHLQALRALLDRYQPAEFSEHLAWSSHGGTYFNDLLPAPFDVQTLEVVCAHLDEVQEFLQRQVLLENPSTYIEFAQSTFTEAEFIQAVVRRTGCGLLLDVNNAYVSCTNHDRDIAAYLLALPLEAVREIHLAGFNRQTDSLGAPLLIDSHGSAVDGAVWTIYASLMKTIGPRPTLIEWDQDVPAFDQLAAEAARAATQLCIIEPAVEALAR